MESIKFKDKVKAIDINIVDKNETRMNVNTTSEFKGSWVLLYYFPAINTSVCSSEVKKVDELLDALKKEKIKVYGYSSDSVETIEKFVKKNNIDHSIISDENKEFFESINFSQASKMSRQTTILNKKTEVVYSAVSPAFAGRMFSQLVDVIPSIKLADSGIPTTCKLEKK